MLNIEKSLASRFAKPVVCVGLGIVGLLCAYLCWRWATAPYYLEYRYVLVAASGVLAFFLLRGSLNILFASREKKRFE